MSVYKGSTKVAGNSASHAHSNKNVLDKFSESSGKPYYNGSPVGGGSLEDLSDVSISTPTEGQALLYDNTAEEWVNQNLPAGGHTMIPVGSDDADISTVSLLANGNDNKVVNAYTVKRYSNLDVITLFTLVSKGTDTIGTWDDDWTESGASRDGWLWHEALNGVLSDDDIEIEPVFDIVSGEVISVYAYRVDDDVEYDGVNGGAIAIKLNSAVRSASGVKIGINLKRQRTQVANFTVISE